MFITQNKSNNVVTLRDDDGDVDILIDGVFVAYFHSSGTLVRVRMDESDRKKLAGVKFDRDGYIVLK